MFEQYDIYARERLTLHCAIELLSPLSHIGQVSGNVSNLRTLKLLDLEGNPRDCFAYSGNALRNGILRRRGTAAVLEELGLQVNPDVHHTLFAGGRIDGSTASDMELDRRIRQLMPWLSVLGTAKPAGVFGSKDAQMIHGRVNVGSAYLICYESARYVFEQFPGALPHEAIAGLSALKAAHAEITSDPFVAPSVEAIAAWESAKAEHIPYLRKVLKVWTEYLAIDQTTRRDSTHDPTLQKFLPSEEVAALVGDSKKGKEKKSDQMIASDRLIMAGARLYSRWDFHATQVEIGWVVDALLRFAESPYLGGKGNRGNGLISLVFWFQRGKERGHFLSVSTGQQQLSPPAQEFHGAYRVYLEQYRGFLEKSKDSSVLRGLLDA